MDITFHGVRGSIPVSGPEYLRYGGDTTCVEIRAGGEVIVIDAGTGIRRLGQALHREGRRLLRLCLTHAHWDHVLGFPFFRPVYVPGTRIEVLGCAPDSHALHDMLARTMRAPSFPVEFGDAQAEVVFRDNSHAACAAGGAAGVEIDTLPLSHPNGGTGYRFREGGRSFVFLTDNELGFSHPGAPSLEECVRFCRDADLLVHDAEFTPEEFPEKRGWGHSTCEESLELARTAGARRLALWHHSPERTDEEVDVIAARCRALAAGTGVEVFAAFQGQRLQV